MKLCSLATALAIYAIVDTSNSAVSPEQGSFLNPGVRQRPRFRYWVPDASVSTDTVASDIQAAGAVGAGGVELLGFYNYGGNFGPPPNNSGIDWAKEGWGLPSWKSLQDVAIKAAVDASLVIDLSLGPNQGAGTPAQYNDSGRAWELVAENITLTSGQRYQGLLPGWGSGELLAGTVGLVVSNESITQVSPNGFFGTLELPGYRVTLDIDSLDEVEVGQDGQVDFTAPVTPANTTYVLFGFYQGQPVLYNTPPFNASAITNYAQNGSWVADHFSAEGAQMVINFWEQHLLDDNVQSLLEQAGEYVWEDSQEWEYENGGVTTIWTPALLTSFSDIRRYQLRKYLPLIVNNNNGAVGSLVSLSTFVTNEADSGQKYINDYRQTLSELNRNYLETLDMWAQSLGMQFSAQPGYNLPVDMLTTIPDVDVPETESLGFNDLIDGYRQFTGAALLAGKNKISTELGAVPGYVYAQTIPDILWHIKRSLVSSINAFVIHGLAFSGPYPSCTWPSYTTFAYFFSEMHGPHLPAWEYYGDWMNYTARSQFILQNSVAKYDIAFWLKNVTYPSITTADAPGDLVSAGYTYQYLSPDNLQLSAAYVKNSILAPDTQEYKAFVVRANDTLTAPGVQKLAQFAEAGLLIFLSGGLPSIQLGNDTAGQIYINETIQSIAQLPNVHVVPYDGLASSIFKQGITPRAVVDMNGSIYTHFSTNGSSNDYVLLLNDAPGLPAGESVAAGKVTIETTGNPHIYDAWTGSVTALEVFARIGNMTSITVSLAGNQSLIIGFDKTSQPVHPKIAETSEVYSITASGSEYTVKSMPLDQNASLTLTNGSTVGLEGSSAPATTLSPWTLILESWTPPANINDSSAPSIRANTTYTLDKLVAWQDIPDVNLTNIAGRGFYSASFDWAVSESTGAVIDLGYILHTSRVSINGQHIPALDPTNAIADIGSYLQDGINSVEIVISTPLGNALIPVEKQLSCLVVMDTTIMHTRNGLVTDVGIKPYDMRVLSL